ncbi:MAG: exo-alpha-sialidase [Phycisphaerae bacterium]|nr:exo-alpha-sialidase [Phycisphaerae bacterium]
MRTFGMVVCLIGLSFAGHGRASAEKPWPPSGEVQWSCHYDASVEPDKARPHWSGGGAPDTERTLEEGVLRIADRGTKKGALHCYSRAWHIEPEHGGVIEVRVKVIDNDSRSGVCILGADGVHEVGVTLYPDRIAIGEDGPTYAMSTRDGFHVYRLAMRGNDYCVWVDGKLVIDGTGKHTHPAYRGRNVVTFGSISSKAKSESLWDDVRYAILGLKPAPPRIAGARDVVIYKKEGIYACFPSLIRLDDGSLLTSFGTRVRRSHIDGTGGSARYLSKDGGRTWEPYTGETPISPGWRCQDGSLAYARAYGWREVPESRREEFAKRDIVVRDVRPGVVAYLQGAYARRSTDGGKTWTKRELELPPHRSLMNHSRSQNCMMKCGVLLAAPYGQLKGQELGQAFCLRSEDNGKTWTFGSLAADPEGKARLNETALIENDRGEVIAMSRSEPPAGGHLFHTISTDRGKTWSRPVRTKIWGYPANLIRLHDGRLLCSYGYRRHPQGVRAILSNDGGHTWDLDNLIVLRDDHVGAGSDLGYPISVELEPGKIFTIYYITLADGVTHVAGTHWQAPKRQG